MLVWGMRCKATCSPCRGGGARFRTALMHTTRLSGPYLLHGKPVRSIKLQSPCSTRSRWTLPPREIPAYRQSKLKRLLRHHASSLTLLTCGQSNPRGAVFDATNIVKGCRQRRKERPSIYSSPVTGHVSQRPCSVNAETSASNVHRKLNTLHGHPQMYRQILCSVSRQVRSTSTRRCQQECSKQGRFPRSCIIGAHTLVREGAPPSQG